MSNKIIFGFILAIILLLPSAFSDFSCKNTLINENNNVIYCEYIGTKNELFSPKLEGNLKYDLEFNEKVMSPNQLFILKVNVDVYNSPEGKQIIKLIQGTFTQDLSITINRLYPDIVSNYNIKYSENNAKVDLILENKTNNIYPIIIKFYDSNNILNNKLSDKVLLLNENESKKIELDLELNNSGKLNYEMLFSNKKINNSIDLNTEIKEIVPRYNIVAFFGLSDFELPINTLFIILNVFLFVIAVVLFTMFIGRLGKVIVKR